MQNLILNRYRPLQEAGSGGFATVMAAWDTRIQRRVAIKCLRLDTTDALAIVGEMRETPGLEEARTAAMLSDPHIAGVYDFEVEGSMAYLIMEYVDGLTLTQVLQREGGALSLDAATCVFDAVAHALEVAHQNQVLHLDIKPDNVLINAQGQVKVTDFGLATLSGAMGYAQAAGGTIGYMPLEQMRLEAPDERTDEWALASLTYEMLMGLNPFRAATLAKAEQAIEQAEIVVPSVVRDDLSEQVDDAIFDALAIDRNDRFATVEEFAEALLPHMGNVRAGSRELAAIVGEVFDDSGYDAPPSAYEVPAGMNALDRVSDKAAAVLYRLWAVAACGFVGYAALSNIDGLVTIAGRLTMEFWIALAVVCAAAAMLPCAGALVATAALAVALCVSGAAVPGIIVAVAGAAWWAFCGRLGHAQAIVPMTGIALGALGFAPAGPLLAGYFLRPRDAVISAACCAAFAVALGMLGSVSMMGWDVFAHGNFSVNPQVAAMVFNAGTWIAAASWVLAALVASLACGRDARVVAALGMAGAAAIVLAGLAVGTFVSSGFVTWLPAAGQIGAAIACGVAGVALTMLGTPRRN